MHLLSRAGLTLLTVQCSWCMRVGGCGERCPAHNSREVEDAQFRQAAQRRPKTLAGLRPEGIAPASPGENCFRIGAWDGSWAGRGA